MCWVCFNGGPRRKKDKGSVCKLYEPSSAPSLVIPRAPTASRVVKKRSLNGHSARLQNTTSLLAMGRRVEFLLFFVIALIDRDWG